MKMVDKIYLYIQDGDHFYDESEDRYIEITGVYKDSKTASATVTEYNYDDNDLQYSQIFTFSELAHFRKEDRYNDGSNY